MVKRAGEMVGATETPVMLQGRQADTALPVRPPAGPGAGLESAAPQRFVLNIENVTGSGKPTNIPQLRIVIPRKDVLWQQAGGKEGDSERCHRLQRRRELT